MDKFILEANYEENNIMAISKGPDSEGKYMFFHYMPVDNFADHILDIQLISPKLRNKFVALYAASYELYENKEDYKEYTETPSEFIDSNEWANNSEIVLHCEGYEDILNAVSNNAQFFTFMKECVCKERNFESDLKEYINERIASHNDAGTAMFVAEQLGYKDLVENTRQQLKKKEVERE